MKNNFNQKIIDKEGLILFFFYDYAWKTIYRKWMIDLLDSSTHSKEEIAHGGAFAESAYFYMKVNGIPRVETRK